MESHHDFFPAHHVVIVRVKHSEKMLGILGSITWKNNHLFLVISVPINKLQRGQKKNYESTQAEYLFIRNLDFCVSNTKIEKQVYRTRRDVTWHIVSRDFFAKTWNIIVKRDLFSGKLVCQMYNWTVYCKRLRRSLLRSWIISCSTAKYAYQVSKIKWNHENSQFSRGLQVNIVSVLFW